MTKTISLVMVMLVLVALATPVFAQNALTRSGSLTATNSGCTATACVQMPLGSQNNGVAVQITGTFTATVTFEGTVDGTNYVSVAAVPVGTTRTLTSTATAAGIWQINTAGYTSVRARVSAFTSGTVKVTINRSDRMPPAQ